MPAQAAGNLVLGQWTVLDANFTPISGMLVPGDVTLTLLRQSGTTMIVASETVAWAEIGATGNYYFSFTPQNTGKYVLNLQEVEPLSLLRFKPFDWDVFAAGAVLAPSYSNAFCAETDVERYLLQAIDTTTKPNDTQVAGWAQGRADVLESLCAGLGKDITPATVESGSRLEGLLREANAIGAALDATIAQTFSTGRQQTEKILSLIAAWVAYAGGYDGGQKRAGFVEQEIKQNAVSLASSHVLSGDTTARTAENAPQDVGLQIRMGDLY